MKIRRHYLALRQHYAQIRDGEPFEATTGELSGVIDCTHRNMVMLLKRMQEERWLTWEAKRGRGNRSTLCFLASVEQTALQEAQELIERSDLRAALALLQSLEEQGGAREQFQQWLSGQFGFHSERRGAARSDILRFPLAQTIYTLDPAATHYAGESHLVAQLFDGLVRMDVQGQGIIPHLAHAWDTDETRTLWTFYLRKGVLFHHGRAMVASDVKYSLERLRKLAPNGLYSWAYGDIADIETPDETTVRIRLAHRNETFLSFLSTNRASIVPQDVCESSGDEFGLRPVGTGPFRLTGNEQGVWVLEAFGSYFQGRGFLDRVEVWTMDGEGGNQEASRMPAFQVMHNVRMADAASGGWQQIRQSGMTCKFLTVNELKDGPLRNPRFRAALSAAIDRDALLGLLSGDVLERAESFWPIEVEPAASDDLGRRRAAYDTGQVGASNGVATPEQRRQPIEPYGSASLSAAEMPIASSQAPAGPAAAGDLRDKLRLATIPQYAADASIIRQLCGQAGIDVDIQFLPAELFKGEARMSADLLLFAVMLDEHRELRLVDLYRSLQQHTLPDMRLWLDQAIEHVLAEPDPARRRNLFLAIEEKLMDQGALVLLYRKHLKTAFQPNVRGIALESLSWVRFRDLWFVPDMQEEQAR
ncbi:ABC transporter substrate-binding protein [Paenibacillus methanolicus]|uniref:MarR-like DNA-binding transcriptional regulator SgrR of sgrS sRNA n=1 Tax=Paenibacillus methanolicus TaxID=582686 RepID=A0A5S5BU68_9BACL|nr:ABC transporter substrate-binding protein [Paenibacillus methanolicus]TYP69700.1 MarR-like DNA-binding transcriptional regulator SgrR of sgrS sRNA [Paenibacillus methanolicus]